MVEYMLRDLTKGVQRDKVCVRVMRKWTYCGTYDNQTPHFIGLVIADKQGTAMYAEIPQQHIVTHGMLLETEKTYTLSRFQVKNARLTYMPFEANLMIEIGAYTLIQVVANPAPTFPKYIYKLTQFSELKPLQGSTKTYIDVIGYIAKVESPSNRIKKDGETMATLREVLIKDMSDTELTVTLWGQEATAFSIDHLYNEASPKVIVVLFLGCLAKNMFQKLQISAGSAFQYFLNPDIPEAQPFFSRFKNQPIYIEQPPPEPNAQGNQPAPLTHKTVKELNTENPFDLPLEGSKCTVKVTDVPRNDNWWYLSCFDCTRSAQLQEDGQYYCTKCKTTETQYRYRLTFFASDGTDQGAFFCYDEIARKLLRANCNALINKKRSTPGFPSEILNLISKTFIFKIQLTRESFSDPNHRIFQVDAILDRSDRRNSTLNIVLPTDNIQQFPSSQTPLAILGTSGTKDEPHGKEPTGQSLSSPLLLTPPPVKKAEPSPAKDQQINLQTPPPVKKTETLPAKHQQIKDFTPQLPAQRQLRFTDQTEHQVSHDNTEEEIKNRDTIKTPDPTQHALKRPRSTHEQRHGKHLRSGTSASQEQE